MAAVELVPRHPRVLVADLQLLGEPVPKARARVTRRGTFTPAKTLHAEMAWEWLMRGRAQTPTREPIILEANFFLSNRRRCDLDNLLKLVVDAGNGIVWNDDSQIVELVAHKHVDRDQPRTLLRVWRTVEED
jgi:Holliday junction resolvase RusA-like endonuclease